jgi:hypothetical protein
MMADDERAKLLDLVKPLPRTFVGHQGSSTPTDGKRFALVFGVEAGRNGRSNAPNISLSRKDRAVH